MANKKNYTLKTAGADDPIYKEGLENQFLHTIKSKQSSQSTLKNLIKALQTNGWKIRKDS